MLLRTLSVLVLFMLLPTVGSPQSRTGWSDIGEAAVQRAGLERRITPQQARYLRAEPDAIRSGLGEVPVGNVLEVGGSSTWLTLPDPDGGSARYRILEVPVMHPDLQRRFPMIRTYTGVGEDGATLKLDITPHGIHAMVTPGDRQPWFIDPVFVGDRTLYQAYHKRALQPSFQAMACGYDLVNDIPTEEARTRGWIEQMGVDRVGDCQMRTYRLALACTGEYASFHGGTVALTLAAMATTMNRVNDMFERDVTLTMVMVPNNDQVVYLNAATDPYTNNDGATMLGENQTTCDAVIGSANYDIGHVFSTGGGGIASLNSPCSGTRKAQGVTGRGAPVGDAFDIDYVAHEMGHQFGGNHTQNNACNRAGSAAVEVGSGITIMGYAGICAPDVASNSIAMFGAYSMQEMAANVTTGTSSSCPATVSLVPQVAPVANAGVDRTIPKSTPFILTGSATDANAGNVLTYSWEQMDAAVATMPPLPTNTGGPAWEPLLPMSTPVRYMPDLSAVLANTTPTWQVLSSVARTYNFRLTVRDNVANGGCNGQDNMVVTVNGASGPFLVTQPNTAVTWTGLSAQTVTWDVANTTAAPVSCSTVDILLSTDGGLTFPTTLLTATPNDGSQSVTVPNMATTTARIMVRANGNIFYDVSNTNFTITAPSVPDYTLSVTNSTSSVCRPASGTYAIQVGAILGYSSPVTLSASGLPAGANASFAPNPVTPGGTSTLTISNTNAVAIGTHGFTLNANSASGPKSLALTLVVSAAPGQVTLVTPANGATEVNTPLTWNADPLADTYTVTLASDAGMSNILETATGIIGASYHPTTANASNTTYYWNVRAVNGCGTGTASSTWSYTTATCTNVSVKIILDRYGNETSWSLIEPGSVVVASGGPYTQQASNGSYPQPDVLLCLPAGCYSLEINDSYGDGMCCTYGTGSISVVDANGIPLTPTPSTFTSSSTASFCIPPTCVSSFPYAEDFGSGFGAWLQTVSDDMDWTLLAGTTPTSSTGPNGDHTSGTGNYLYLESSTPNNPSKVADLVGPCFDLSGLTTAELTFWYNMYGATMGSLRVDVWNGSVWANGSFFLSGDQGTNWQQGEVDLSAYVGGTVRIRFHGVTGSGFTSDMAIDDIQLDGSTQSAVTLSLKAWLEGPFEAGLMADSLRFKGLLPLGEPYTDLGFDRAGAGGESTSAAVFAQTGVDAVVDWVLVELRSTADPTSVLATRAGLIQRDGDVVDVDGLSPLSFAVAPGSYHVALRHRNHLGVMTADPIGMGPLPALVDLRSGAVPLFGVQPVKDVAGVKFLWAGNAINDDLVLYTGEANDRDAVLARIQGIVPTHVVSGYHTEDLNLDGNVKYTGADNDRDIILSNIGGVVPTNVRVEQLP